MQDEPSRIGDPPFPDPSYLALLDEFEELYARRPLRNNWGGMQSTNCFWIWATVKLLRPRHVIESGVWMGHNTWFLEQAAPEAEIFCLDPRPCWEHRQHYRSDRATYRTDDFYGIEWQELLDPATTVCVFDDHQHQLQRARVCAASGLRHLLFDDNYPGELEFTLAHVRHRVARGRSPAQVEQDARWLAENAVRYRVFPPMYRVSPTGTDEAARRKKEHLERGLRLYRSAVEAELFEPGPVPTLELSERMIAFLSGGTVTARGLSAEAVDETLFEIGMGAPRVYPDAWYAPRFHAGEPFLERGGVSDRRSLFTRSELSWQGNYTWPSYLELR